MTISAPALAKPMAMPRPNPPLPPVTIATLPRRSNSSIMLSCIPDLRHTRLLTIVVRAVYTSYLDEYISPATRGSIQLRLQQYYGGGRHIVCLPVKLTGI